MQIEITLISENFPFLRQGVLEDLGVGLVPDYVTRDALKSGEVIMMLDEYRLHIFGTRMHLMFMPSPHQTRAVRLCIRFFLSKAHAIQNDVLS